MNSIESTSARDLGLGSCWHSSWERSLVFVAGVGASSCLRQ